MYDVYHTELFVWRYVMSGVLDVKSFCFISSNATAPIFYHLQPIAGQIHPLFSLYCSKSRFKTLMDANETYSWRSTRKMNIYMVGWGAEPSLGKWGGVGTKCVAMGRWIAQGCNLSSIVLTALSSFILFICVLFIQQHCTYHFRVTSLYPWSTPKHQTHTNRSREDWTRRGQKKKL